MLGRDQFSYTCLIYPCGIYNDLQMCVCECVRVLKYSQHVNMLCVENYHFERLFLQFMIIILQHYKNH